MSRLVDVQWFCDGNCSILLQNGGPFSQTLPRQSTQQRHQSQRRLPDTFVTSLLHILYCSVTFVY